MNFVLFIIVVFIISAIIVVPIFITSSKKENKKRDMELQSYKEFIQKNGMRKTKSVSYKNLVQIDVDSKEKLLGMYSYFESEAIIVKFNEVLDFEIIENGNSVISSRSGSAVVGGLLFGGLGAVAGASGSRAINDECTMLKLKIYTSDIQNSVITLDFLDDSIPKVCGLYEELTEIINEMISLLKIAIENNKAINESIENTKQNQGNQLSSLKELAELKEQGIITEKEFNETKKKILSKI